MRCGLIIRCLALLLAVNFLQTATAQEIQFKGLSLGVMTLGDSLPQDLNIRPISINDHLLIIDTIPGNYRYYELDAKFSTELPVDKCLLALDSTRKIQYVLMSILGHHKKVEELLNISYEKGEFSGISTTLGSANFDLYWLTPQKDYIVLYHYYKVNTLEVSDLEFKRFLGRGTEIEPRVFYKRQASFFP